MFHVPAHKQTNPDAKPGQVLPNQQPETRITSVNYAGQLCVLVTTEGNHPVIQGGQYNNFRGDLAVITGGRAPHHSGSTGKVWTKDGGEFYPGVFGLKWVAGA